MKKKYGTFASIAIIVAAALALSACGNNNKENGNEAAASGATASPVESAASPSASASAAEATPSPSPSESPAAELSAHESLALDYVNIFLNGSDLDAKKTFVENNIHPDVAPIFAMSAGVVATEDKQLADPTVVKSVPYEGGGQKGTMVLLQGKHQTEDAEMIILIVDDKVSWAYDSGDLSQEGKQAFDAVKVLF